MVGEHDGLKMWIGMLGSSQEATTDFFYISTGSSFVVISYLSLHLTSHLVLSRTSLHITDTLAVIFAFFFNMNPKA
jgi:hypothetical protein